MIRVLLVDDHALVRDGVRLALEGAGMAVCGETDDGTAVVDLVTRTAPDVVLIDVALDDVDGLALVPRILARTTPPRVVVLSMFDDPRVIEEAADAGAHAYLVKECTLEALVDTVRAVASGVDLLATLRDPERREHRSSLLSGRELEVLQLVASGASTADVAARLYLSAKTVKNHLAAVYEKLGVSSRVQAVAAGVRLGLVVLAREGRE